MTTDQLKTASSLKGKMDKLEDFLRTFDRLDHFCNGFGVHESKDTTEACKALLKADLEKQLAEASAEFANL